MALSRTSQEESSGSGPDFWGAVVDVRVFVCECVLALTLECIFMNILYFNLIPSLT